MSNVVVALDVLFRGFRFSFQYLPPNSHHYQRKNQRTISLSLLLQGNQAQEAMHYDASFLKFFKILISYPILNPNRISFNSISYLSLQTALMLSTEHKPQRIEYLNIKLYMASITRARFPIGGKSSYKQSAMFENENC